MKAGGVDKVRLMLAKANQSEIAVGVAEDCGFRVVHAGMLRNNCLQALQDVKQHPELYTYDTHLTLTRIISAIGSKKHYMLKVDALGGYETKTVDIDGYSTLVIKKVKLLESE